MAKGLAKVILVLESVVLAAMLLADFGVLPSKVDPLSVKSIMMHLTALILIIASAVILKKPDDRS